MASMINQITYNSEKIKGKFKKFVLQSKFKSEYII